MELSKKEKEVLVGILNTQVLELTELIETSEGKDKEELENNLVVVKGILEKLL